MGGWKDGWMDGEINYFSSFIGKNKQTNKKPNRDAEMKQHAQGDAVREQEDRRLDA